MKWLLSSLLLFLVSTTVLAQPGRTRLKLLEHQGECSTRSIHDVFSRLPDELLGTIISKVPIKDICQLKRTSKGFYERIKRLSSQEIQSLLNALKDEPAQDEPEETLLAELFLLSIRTSENFFFAHAFRDVDEKIRTDGVLCAVRCGNIPAMRKYRQEGYFEQLLAEAMVLGDVEVLNMLLDNVNIEDVD